MTEFNYKLLKYTLYTCFFIITTALICFIAEGFLYYFSISTNKSRYNDLINNFEKLSFLFIMIITICILLKKKK